MSKKEFMKSDDKATYDGGQGHGYQCKYFGRGIFDLQFLFFLK
jgi:hypothetical protein